jgi:hypothetical protein
MEAGLLLAVLSACDRGNFYGRLVTPAHPPKLCGSTAAVSQVAYVRHEKKVPYARYGSAPIQSSIFREGGILVGPLDAVGDIYAVGKPPLARFLATKL